MNDIIDFLNSHASARQFTDKEITVEFWHETATSFRKIAQQRGLAYAPFPDNRAGLECRVAQHVAPHPSPR